MSGKRMSWLLCAAFLLALMVLPALAETDEIVLTFGGDCVLGTREQWKKKKNTFDTVIAVHPDVFNVNIETVKELQKAIRPSASYERTLDVLRYIKQTDPTILTKTGFMVGLGETEEQISRLMDDILAVGCDILTIGQYLQPSPEHWKLDRYATPEDFARYKEMALQKGFRHVASAPLARSSYRAWEALEDVHDLY